MNRRRTTSFGLIPLTGANLDCAVIHLKGWSLMWRGSPNTCVRVIVTVSLVTTAFFVDPPILSAQNYGEKLLVQSLTLPGDLLPTLAEKSQGTPAGV